MQMAMPMPIPIQQTPVPPTQKTVATKTMAKKSPRAVVVVDVAVDAAAIGMPRVKQAKRAMSRRKTLMAPPLTK